MRDYFYLGSVKKILVAFSNLFEDVRVSNVIDGELKSFVVPLVYKDSDPKKIATSAEKDKYNYPVVNQDLSTGVLFNSGTMMAYELVSMSPARERATNPLTALTNPSKGSSGFSRVPYDFSFALYIKSPKIDHALQVVEQIVPYFTPALNVEIIDHPVFGKSSIPINLDSVGFSMPDLDFSEDRVVEFTLSFTVKAYLYQNPSTAGIIKRTLIDVSDMNHFVLYKQKNEVVPFTANFDDPHTILTEEQDNE